VVELGYEAIDGKWLGLALSAPVVTPGEIVAQAVHVARALKLVTPHTSHVTPLHTDNIRMLYITMACPRSQV